jgi:hypothetical protein
MRHSRAFWLFAFCLVAGLVPVCFFASGPAESPARTAAKPSLYHADHEFHLSRSLLFAGRSGGLSAIGSDERDFPTPFFLTLEDALEGRESDGRGRPFSQWALSPIKEGCFLCHSLPGVSSFNSYFNYRNNLNGSDSAARPFPLLEMSVAEVAGAAIKWKEGRPHWTALRKLLAE